MGEKKSRFINVSDDHIGPATELLDHSSLPTCQLGSTWFTRQTKRVKLDEWVRDIRIKTDTASQSDGICC